MKKIICLYVLGVLSVCSVVVAMESETCEIAATPEEKKYVAEKLKEGKIFIAQHKYKDALCIMDNFKNLSENQYRERALAGEKWQRSIYAPACMELRGELLQVLQNTQEFVEQGKLEYENAFGILNEFKDLSGSIHADYKYKFDRKIKELAQLLCLKQAEDYASKHEYKAAYAILNRLMELKVNGAVKLCIETQKQEAAWEKAQGTIAPVQQKWLFITDIPKAAPVKKIDWKIKDQKLFLNLDATEIITVESFATLIKQATNKKLPFILVMVQSSDSSTFFPHFFGADVLISLMMNLSKDNKFINPMTRELVNKMEMYVIGNDGVLRLLKDNVDANYLKQFVDYTGYTDDPDTGRRIHNYKLKPELGDTGKPGAAQVFIADCYGTQAESVFLGFSIKSKPVKRQLERLWLDWAIQNFAPEDAVQKEQAAERLNAIPDRPELIMGQLLKAYSENLHEK